MINYHQIYCKFQGKEMNKYQVIIVLISRVFMVKFNNYTCPIRIVQITTVIIILQQPVSGVIVLTLTLIITTIYLILHKITRYLCEKSKSEN